MLPLNDFNYYSIAKLIPSGAARMNKNLCKKERNLDGVSEFLILYKRLHDNIIATRTQHSDQIIEISNM